MKTKLILAATASFVMLTGCGVDYSWKEKKKAEAPKPTVRLTLLPHGSIEVGKPVTIHAKLNDLKDGYAILDEDLTTVHTQKFHLLAIDPTLTDYQHIHPQPTATPGIRTFTFTPKLGGGYRFWADVTPTETSKQEFAAADLGNPRRATIATAESHAAMINGYQFALSFDAPPQVEKAAVGKITVTKGGDPVTVLEPVMGAYAHIVAFHEDFHTVIHTHPMGTDAGARGGPELAFRIEPGKPGFIKLFAQVKIGGKDMFVPFGVRVSPAPAQ